MPVSEPSVGATGWNTWGHDVTTIVNSVETADARLDALEAGSGGVASVTAANSTITVAGTGTNPTVAVNAITESQVTNLTTDLAAKAAKASNLSDLTSASTARTNLGLAAIAASGSATDLSTGTVPLARLGASGAASSSTFLRGDNAWATPVGGGGGSGFGFNVKDYGATGNGTTDDATALQAALDAAGTAGGGRVYLPAGTYATTKCIGVPANVTLFGDGPGASTIKAISGLMTGSNGGVNGGYTVLGQKAFASGNIVVRDLTVNANHSGVGVLSGSANRQNAGVVDFRDLAGVSFINIAVEDGWFYHLAVWTSTDVLVQGCKVTGPGTSGTYDQLDGVHLTCCTRQTIADCQIDMGAGTDGDDGIALHQFPSSGIDVIDAVIANNRIRGGNNGSGIDLANADGTIKGVTITGNLIHDGTNKGVVTNWFGLFTGTTRDVTIVGNTIRDCAGGSIVLGDLTGNNAPYSLFRVSGNQCSRSNGQPFQISTTNASGISIERASLPPATLTDGASVALDASLGRVHTLTATGNRTILAPSGATLDGQEIVIAHTASGGARTLALTTGSTGAFAFGTTITALSATTSGATDYITCIFSASALRWRVTQYVKGF